MISISDGLKAVQEILQNGVTARETPDIYRLAHALGAILEAQQGQGELLEQANQRLQHLQALLSQRR